LTRRFLRTYNQESANSIEPIFAPGFLGSELHLLDIQIAGALTMALQNVLSLAFPSVGDPGKWMNPAKWADDKAIGRDAFKLSVEIQSGAAALVVACVWGAFYLFAIVSALTATTDGLPVAEFEAAFP
jgi:hypothetical protein